VIYCHWYCE